MDNSIFLWALKNGFSNVSTKSYLSRQKLVHLPILKFLIISMFFADNVSIYNNATVSPCTMYPNLKLFPSDKLYKIESLKSYIEATTTTIYIFEAILSQCHAGTLKIILFPHVMQGLYSCVILILYPYLIVLFF